MPVRILAGVDDFDEGRSASNAILLLSTIKNEKD